MLLCPNCGKENTGTQTHSDIVCKNCGIVLDNIQTYNGEYCCQYDSGFTMIVIYHKLGLHYDRYRCVELLDITLVEDSNTMHLANNEKQLGKNGCVECNSTVAQLSDHLRKPKINLFERHISNKNMFTKLAVA